MGPTLDLGGGPCMEASMENAMENFMEDLIQF